MKLYSGMDLHSNTTQVGIMDETRKPVIDRKFRNDPELILKFLKPYRADLEGIVVESTYNWYWLVDALQEGSYRVVLVKQIGAGTGNQAQVGEPLGSDWSTVSPPLTHEIFLFAAHAASHEQVGVEP